MGWRVDGKFDLGENHAVRFLYFSRGGASMEKPSNKWPDTDKARSLLFVAQSIQQLSSIKSFESFRMMTLDSVARISEAKRLVRDIQKGLSKYSFSSVNSELCWTINNDPAINHKEFDQVSNALKFFETMSINDKTDMARVFSRLDVLESKISPNYKNSLQSYILANYLNASKRNDVHLAISYYLAHLSNNGYSRQYIYDVATDVFFTEDISRASHQKIIFFFDNFDFSDAKFEVYFQLDDLALSYLKDVYDLTHIPDDEVPPAVTSGFVLSGLSIDTKKQFARVEKRARDMFSAARDVSDEIGSISSVCVLSAWEFELPLPRDFCVYAKRKKQARGYTVDSVDAGGSMKIAKHPARGVKDSKLDVKQIRDHFDRDSVERIHNSLSTVYSALEDKNYDSRLISIWSSFEALLSPPPSNTARIAHYVDVVAPCVIARY